jgi:cytochrome c556
MIIGRRWDLAGATVWWLVAAPMAVGQSTDPAARAIEYRQSLYRVVAYNFGPLVQHSRDRIELAPESMRTYAERLAIVAEFTREAYPPLSSTGTTKVRAQVWSDRAAFDQMLSEFIVASRTLADVTARANATRAEVKSAVGVVGNTCKSCHDRFREK